MAPDIAAPDLTQRPPRSPRVKLGGLVLLPRMLDKGRATLVGKNGDYYYDCPMDKRLLAFIGIDAESVKQQLATGKGDGKMLEWIQGNCETPREPWEIDQWSAYHAVRAPGDSETRGYFDGLIPESAKEREDITSWFDVLDVDDHVSFGGKA